jgi:hypothetical protein
MENQSSREIVLVISFCRFKNLSRKDRYLSSRTERNYELENSNIEIVYSTMIILRTKKTISY